MKMKKTFAAILASTLALSLPLTATAATWDNVDDYDKLSTAFGDTESEIYIIVTGDIVNENGNTLTTGIGQTYTINGEEYTLTDIIIGGSGDVVINADLEGKDDAGLTTNDEVSVTVNGDIHGKEMDGIDANDATKVTVNGDVKSDGSDGLDMDDEAQVIVNGDVYGGAGADGVDASDDTKAIVNGDVYGGSGKAPDEDGNLVNGNINDPSGYSDGGDGIEADKNAEVYVDGSVYGGDSYGTYSYGGDGIDAWDNSVVNVTGNTVGGDQIANPDVVPKTEVDGSGVEYTTHGYAGDGVYMSNTADVTVGGNAIGGNASGQEAVAGSGAYIELTFTSESILNEETGEYESSKIIPAQITVKGELIGGESTGKDGHNGYAVFYAVQEDNPIEGQMLDEDFIKGIASDENKDYVRYTIAETMSRLVFEAGLNYIDHEDRLLYQEDYKQKVTELAEEYGVDTTNLKDFKEVVDAVPEENLEEFACKAMNIGNEILGDMALRVYAIPDLTTSGMESKGTGGLIGAPTDELEKYIAVAYIDLVESEEESESESEEESESESKEESESESEIESEETEEDDDDQSEKETSNKTEAGKKDDSTADSPKTGDKSMTALMSAMMIISALCLIVIGRKIKKR